MGAITIMMLLPKNREGHVAYVVTEHWQAAEAIVNEAVGMVQDLEDAEAADGVARTIFAETWTRAEVPRARCVGLGWLLPQLHGLGLTRRI